jgi:hypothetical protein
MNDQPMKDQDTAARTEILARLALSREELRRVLDPPRPQSHANGSTNPGGFPGGFPRSRTMQMLMSQRGLGIIGAGAAGLLLARPALALRLLRMVPASAFAKMMLTRALTAFRTKKE